MAHSRFSPSATERDTLCAPSFLLNEQLPDRNSTDSAHGTAAHHLGELCLRTDKDTATYAGCMIAVGPKGECRFVHLNAPLRDDEQGFEVDDEMVAAVQSYVDACREIPGDHYVEVRVEHTRYCPDVDEWGDPLPPQYGTSDHIGVNAKAREMYVDDLKYGKGVKVFAERNKQATKYALGAVDEYDWLYDFDDDWTVFVRIHQPRLDHLDVWKTTIGELRAFGEQIKLELTEVFNPDAPFNPGEKQCRFCKAASRCKAKHEYVHSIAALAFDDEDQLTDPRLLTNEDLAEAWQRYPLFKQHYEAIVTELLHLMKNGEPAPGLKLVVGNTHRQWKDPVAVKAKLKELGVSPDAIEKRKLVSPNEAEKLLTKDKRPLLNDLWEKPPGGPVIALATDKREAYDGTRTVEGFDDEDDDGLND